MKYKVVISALFIDGVKYRRGDIIELSNPELYGVNIEPVVEPEAKPKRRKKSENL
jgi:signal peptidase I